MLISVIVLFASSGRVWCAHIPTSTRGRSVPTHISARRQRRRDRFPGARGALSARGAADDHLRSQTPSSSRSIYPSARRIVRNDARPGSRAAAIAYKVRPPRSRKVDATPRRSFPVVSKPVWSRRLAIISTAPARPFSSIEGVAASSSARARPACGCGCSPSGSPPSL